MSPEPGFTVSKPLFSPGKRMRLPTVVVRGDVLASWLTVSAYTRSRLAAELGVSKGRVSQILTSLEEPSAHLIAKLLTLTRLPFDRLFRLIQESPPATNDHEEAATPQKKGKHPSGTSSPGPQSPGVLVSSRSQHH